MRADAGDRLFEKSVIRDRGTRETGRRTDWHSFPHPPTLSCRHAHRRSPPSRPPPLRDQADAAAMDRGGGGVVIGNRDRLSGIQSANLQRHPAAPAAAHLTPAPRQFMIRLPRPRWIGVAAGGDRVIGSYGPTAGTSLKNGAASATVRLCIPTSTSPSPARLQVGNTTEWDRPAPMPKRPELPGDT